MAVIVQSDPFLGLIRKIGYSVGLEYVVERAAALVELYVRERRMSIASWRTLVAETFGRAEPTKKSVKSPADHIADFFSELNLIKLNNQQILPLHGLEAGSILRRHIKDDRQFMSALRFLVCVYILEADGDIFLNVLMGKFEPEMCRDLLGSMVDRKRQLASGAIRNPSLRQRMYDVISIKTQTSKRSEGPGASPFARRQTPPRRSFRPCRYDQ